MTEPLVLQRERLLLQDLTRLAAERARNEARIEAEFQTRQETEEQDYQKARDRLSNHWETEKATNEREYQQALQTIPARFESETMATEREYTTMRQKISAQFRADQSTIEEEFEQSRWESLALYEGSKKEAKGHSGKIQQSRGRLSTAQQRLATVHQDARAYLAQCRQAQVQQRIQVAPSTEGQRENPFQELEECVAIAEEQLVHLKALFFPRCFRGVRLLALFLVIGLPAIFLAHWFVSGVWWPAVGVAATGIFGGLLSGIFYLVARLQVRQCYEPMCQATVDAEIAIGRCKKRIAASRQKLHVYTEEARKRYKEDLQKIQEKRDRLLADITRRRDENTRRADERFLPLLAEIKKRYEQGLRQAEETHQRQQMPVQAWYADNMQQAEEKHARQVAENQAWHQREWNELTNRWRQGLDAAQAAIADIQEKCHQSFPVWSDPSWQQWEPPPALPSGLRFGEFQVDIGQIPYGISTHERLRALTLPAFTLPALLPFPYQASMLCKANDAGRAAAVQTLQAVMLRFLTSLPAGKVRFTIIDPVGLGENFAAFMHLADYDEALVTSKIWVEGQHIEQRLADLMAHMENVIQKYLRNQFQSIEEYNEKAGEVAEAFRVLVVANFPANFTSEAARRLASIASSGSRCGVFTLISVDTRQPLPHGFQLKDLELQGVHLNIQGQQLAWKDSDFEKYPLQLEKLPDAEFCTRAIQIAGEAARTVKRVEVPFEFVAPPVEEYWTSDSRGGIRVPLGRAGATKLQYLQLGRGTAQHVLIAGKTGSGKSSLLHVLITNLALRYSPEEVELYLIDFKKGVEFKTYATYELPHARVVAIESDREFGLSVLQRLDAELKVRGDRFRDAGVQDVKSYRQTEGATLCPRILLIVDEFQEFFVEDDKIAQEVALLLDRLVRQGRAFGVHIHLGSQTLSGAFSLARSTIDQMAVRIALQCSEADAYLVLSKDNSAARLLSRPGEAIYNDANGMVEGNDVFQIVWLSDKEREDYLTRLQRLAQQRNYKLPQMPIIFEGNIPADIKKNETLHQLLEAGTWPANLRAARACLGEAIAIKDPTTAVFQVQTGTNLLMLGQQEEPILGIVAMTVISLGAQQPPAEKLEATRGAHFYMIDSSPADAPNVNFLTDLAQRIPHRTRVAGWRDLPAILAEIAAEIDRRQKEHQEEVSSIYLLIHGLQRFRDLRRGEDDFGFSRRSDDQPAKPSELLATIVREGPAVGVHTVVWCDSLNNLNRSFDRQGLREFGLRILFQMSAADSSTLIDTPMASKLGANRALFCSEDMEYPEKFRPYGLPSEDWLQWAQQRLKGKHS